MAGHTDQKIKLLQLQELNASRRGCSNPYVYTHYEGISQEVDDNKGREMRPSGISQDVHENK
jgi:Cdc6-like AAA superfamily ATPase